MKRINYTWCVVVPILVSGGGWSCADELAGQDDPSQPSEVTQPLAAQAAAGPAAGKEFRHTLSSSRFKLGAMMAQRQEAGAEKTIGSEGVFAINMKNGAALAVPNAPASSGKKDATDNPKPFKALSSDESVHNARVLKYFQNAGLPMDEVVATHVTTVMEGHGSKSQRITPENTHFVSYATHLQRAISGIPVVDSQAWATFDSDDNVASEGVFWPAIPANVVAKAVALKRLADNPSDHAALRAKIARDVPELSAAEGRVVIAHSSAAYDQAAVAVAGYEVTTHGAGAQIRRFDENGSRIQLPDEVEGPRPSDPVKTGTP